MTSLGQVCLLAAMVASGYSAFACAAGGCVAILAFRAAAFGLEWPRPPR